MANLSNLGGGSFVSNNALANILVRVREDPTVLEVGLSRWSVKRKRTSEIAVNTFFGPLLRSKDLVLEAGGTHRMWYADPVSLIDHLCHTSAWFLSLLNATWERTGDEMWRIVWYADEVTPGNQLRPLNHRKTCLRLIRSFDGLGVFISFFETFLFGLGCYALKGQ